MAMSVGNNLDLPPVALVVLRSVQQGFFKETAVLLRSPRPLQLLANV